MEHQRRDDESPAYLFEEDGTSMLAVARDCVGTDLPESESGWRLLLEFSLGLHHPVPVPMEVLPVIRGLSREGYYMWDRGASPQPPCDFL